MRPLSTLVVCAAASLVLGSAATLDAATVERERLQDNPDIGYYSAVAVSPDGVVHRVYREADGSLVHAWGGLGDWQTEVVDTHDSVLRSDDIAIDAEGRVHLLYYWNNREDPSQPRVAVVHAVRGDEGWVRTTLANPNVLSGTALAVGPDGRPHAAWLSAIDYGPGPRDVTWGPFVVATFNGEGWESVALPSVRSAWDLQVDSAGHSHVLGYSPDGDTIYLTDASGSWGMESLPLPLGLARLAVSGDRVHVAGFEITGDGRQRLRHFVRGTSGWEVDGRLLDEGRTYERDGLHLAIGPDGRLAILFSERRQQVWDGDADRWMFFFDGESWTSESIGTRLETAEVDAVAFGPDGVLHVVCGGREAPWIDYLRIGGDPVETDESDLRVVEGKDGVVVKGRLRIRNRDYRDSPERILGFARAERDEYRPGDTPVGRERRIRRMHPGTWRSIPIRVRVPDPTPEERLLLLLDRAGPDGRDGRPEAAGAIRLRP